MNALGNMPNKKKISLDIISRLTSKGFKALFVGGMVRDMVIMSDSKYKPSDFDILTNAPIDEVIRIFSGEKTKKVGKSFAVCIVNGIEVSSCRTVSSKIDYLVAKRYLQNESLSQDNGYNYVGRDIVSNSSSTYFEDSLDFPYCDLAHRDITINSMAYDPLRQTVIDPFNGRQDLEKRIIRFTGSPDERIAEDPIRMVRVCRFVSLIDGTIESSTLESIIRHRNLLENSLSPNDIADTKTNFIGKVASERIRIEIIKAMAHKKPSLFFRALHSAKLLEMIFPSLSRCVELDGGHHHGETVFEHCLLSGDALSPKNSILRLAGYLHDVGKYDAAQIKDGHITFPDHETMVQAIIDDLNRLRFSTEDITFIEAVIKTHMRPLKSDSTPKAVRRLLAFLKEHAVSWQTFMQMRIADKASNLAKFPYTREDIKLRVMKIWQELTNGNLKGKPLPLSIKDLEISGHDIMEILNIPPGPTVGKTLQYLLDCVLDEPSLNNFNTLSELTVNAASCNAQNIEPL